MIEKLTQAQIDTFPGYVREWTDIGTCTAPADRPRAERAIQISYERAGLNKPKEIIWFDSPLGMFSKANVRDNVRDNVLAELDATATLLRRIAEPSDDDLSRAFAAFQTRFTKGGAGKQLPQECIRTALATLTEGDDQPAPPERSE